MLRHRLASFFDPKSLIVITDKDLPILQEVPPALGKRTTILHIQAGQTFEQVADEMPLSEAKELALICVTPSLLPQVLNYLEFSPPKALLMLAPNTVDVAPKETKALLQQWTSDHKVMMLGSRSFGVQRPHLNLNLSRSPLAKAGKVAVVSQSRMLVMSVLDWALDTNVGLSTVVSLGETQDVDMPEIIEYLAGDPRTDSIALYLDKFSSGRELISAIRMAASVKPVVVLRAGRTDDKLMGSDQVFDAALRRSGAVRVSYFVDLFSTLKALSHKRRPKGGRVAVIANGRAQAQLMMDEMLSSSQIMKKADFSPSTMTKLTEILGTSSLVENPIITYESVTGNKLIDCIKALQEDANVDAIMPILAPDDATDMSDVVEQLAAFTPKMTKPVLNTLLGEYSMKPLRKVIDQSGSPAFRTPETALSGMHALISYHYNQQLLQQIRIPLLDMATPDRQAGIDLINGVRTQQRRQLTSEEGHQLLKFYHADIQWGEHQEDEQYSVEDDIPALKILVKRDPVFGPWIYFGEGGHEVKIPENDRGLDLPPLNAYLAAQLIERSRLYQQELQVYVEPPIFKKLQKLLEVVSELVTDFPGIEELEINPIIIGYRDLNVHDIRIKLTEQFMPDMPEETGYTHMAIYPYPDHLIEHHTFKDGREWTLRPIRPEDADQMQDFIRELSDESRYMRFVSMMKELSPKMLTRYTYVDYHKELALVATTTIPNPENRGLPKEIIIGLAHYLRNADGVGAEYALVIADNWQGHGLGRKLMSKLLEEAKDQGLEYIEGVVLANNKPMLGLMTGLGLINDMDPEDPMMRRVWMSFK
ncbi:GNAT family N-acetyltransferase [Pelistega europaea]|uniref:GNAT family N-acetyltransferase n=1 Tax=Pelistega europaea TaxID=106147 RepID=A0A7Y4LAH8_9BURK|nr:GNAT family N-acetyltransferase [Pelistega europaea]NOL49944.1 GNAT family N-acetyltransferase [Pelistega europaea]